VMVTRNNVQYNGYNSESIIECHGVYWKICEELNFMAHLHT
jgi:hypothetical protein